MGGLRKLVRWNLHMGRERKGGAEAAPSFLVWMKWGLFPNRGTWEASKGRCAQGCGGAGLGWSRHFRGSRESTGGVWGRSGEAQAGLLRHQEFWVEEEKEEQMAAEGLRVRKAAWSTGAGGQGDALLASAIRRSNALFAACGPARMPAHPPQAWSPSYVDFLPSLR